MTVETSSPDLPAEDQRPRWPWWLVGIGAGLLGGWALLYFGLDPWLRRQLEKQVAEQSGGRYSLRIGELRTRLADRSVTLVQVRLRPTTQFRPGPDSLPKLSFDLPRFRLSGISLGALWRRKPQHFDSLALVGLRLRIDSLPAAASRRSQPLHERLPARLPGFQLRHFVVRDAQGFYRRRRPHRAAVERLDVTARDVLVSRAGAADTTRVAYARYWTVELRGAQGLLGHHFAQVQALNFNSQTGALTVDSIRLRPTRIGGRGPSYLVMRIGRLRLTGLRPTALVRHRFQADSLRIAGLHFDLTAPAKSPPLPHQMLAPLLRRFVLADARLTDGYVRVRGVSYVPIVRDLQLHARGLQLDSAGYADPARVYYANAWELRSGMGEIIIDAPYYRVGWGSLVAESGPGLFAVTDVRLAPTMPIGQLARRKGHEVSHISLTLPQLRATGFDFAALLHRRGLRVAEIVLRQPTILVVGDGRYRINPEASVVTPEAVGKLPFEVNLRRLRLEAATLRFSYTSPTSQHRPATMQVTRLNGTITNAANTPDAMSARTPMVARATGWLQGRCHLEATGRFNLLDPLGRHQLTGTFGAAPFAMLNTVTEPASLMRFKEGQVERVDITLNGDRDHVTGTMRAAYRGMHVRLLTPDLNQNLLTKIKSKASNKLVLHDNNPNDPGKPLRVGRIESRRERRFSVFALWRQGLACGLLTSLGVSDKMAIRTSEKKTNPGE